MVYGNTTPSRTPLPGLPYRQVESLLTQTEREFARILEIATQRRYRILVKVRLCDVFDVTIPEGKKNPEWWRAFNRISNRPFDFLLVDPKTWKPLVTIELDDKSHYRYVRHERDFWVNEICEEAQLPLLRIAVRRSWVIEDIRRMIQSALSLVTRTAMPDDLLN